MKKFLILLFLLGLSFANDATPAILNARYDYISCDVGYAKEWLEMRENCAEQEQVPVFDSSEPVQKYDELMAELKDAADEGHPATFSLVALQIGGNSIKLIQQVLVDAFDEKTPAFFSCVRGGEPPLKDEKELCRDAALENEKDAAKSYVNNEIQAAEDEMGRLDARGLDTSGMQGVVDHAKDLVFDIDYAYDSKDPKEVRKLHLRNSRLVLLFRAEQVLTTINYMEPIIEDSNNKNKDEILERGSELREGVEALIEECGYSDAVDNNAQYATQNAECWEEGIDLYREFNELGKLILGGIR